MGKKITTEDYKQRLFESVGDKYSLKEGQVYKGRDLALFFHCNIHNIDFERKAECFMRGPNDVRGSCPQCSQELRDSKKKQSKIVCSYCGKEFFRSESKLSGSKSGLYFCCREHKDLGQRLENNIKEIWPNHYKSIEEATESTYRKKAFLTYKHCCAVCGWSEDEDILEVHHIDEDRLNNELTNLIILCPICHRKLTTHKYILYNKQIIKK